MFSGKAEIDFLPVMVKVYHYFLRLSTKYFIWLTIVASKELHDKKDTTIVEEMHISKLGLGAIVV